MLASAAAAPDASGHWCKGVLLALTTALVLALASCTSSTGAHRTSVSAAGEATPSTTTSPGFLRALPQPSAGLPKLPRAVADPGARLVDGARVVTQTIYFEGPQGPRLAPPPPHVRPALAPSAAFCRVLPKRFLGHSVPGNCHKTFEHGRYRLGIFSGPDLTPTLAYAEFGLSSDCFKYHVSYCLSWLIAATNGKAGDAIEQPITQ